MTLPDSWIWIQTCVNLQLTSEAGDASKRRQGLKTGDVLNGVFGGNDVTWIWFNQTENQTTLMKPRATLAHSLETDLGRRSHRHYANQQGIV